MTVSKKNLLTTCRIVIDEIRGAIARNGSPIVVALDGASGSGKSVIASTAAKELNAVVIPSDDFYAAEVTNAEWDALTSAERARKAIDWRRLRREALEPLLAGKTARWQAFDFNVGPRADGSYALGAGHEVREPKPVIILDGAYSSRPELSDMLAITILVDAPTRLRWPRLAAREEKQFLARWHERWDDAEAHYFAHVRPPATFDLVVRN